MNVINRRIVSMAAMLFIVCLISGCGGPGRESKGLAPASDLGTTIGSLGEVVVPESIAVDGYGLVGALRGTGSAECPPQIRAYLMRYIRTQLSDRGLDVEKFISSRDTAVVQVEAVMPAAVLESQHFDVRVTALPGTQTTSLEHGWLYSTELKAKGTFGIATKVIADAEGPVFIDKIGPGSVDKRVGYVLAGGKILAEQRISLELGRPHYQTTSRIRNRLNERFGFGTARAASPDRIELTVPAKYRGHEQRFIAIVRATYLGETPEVTRKRIMAFVRELAVSRDKQASEIALEAIGNASLGKLAVLLNSANEEVRFRAARCMLNLGSERGLQALRQTAMDRNSPHRLPALQAITAAAERGEAAAISRRLLLDEDFDVRLAAYEQLRQLDDIGVTRNLIARSFFLEQVGQGREKVIFACRSGQPRIVLFGAPMFCRDNIFVESADGDIIINAPAGQKYVSLIRKHPKRASVIAQLRSSFELTDIIRTLCEEPVKEAEEAPRGLGVSYPEVMALLKQMCDKHAVRAAFRAGPLPKIG